MVTIINYRERYESDAESLNPEMTREIRSLRDVVKDSVCVALCDGEFVGFGFLADANPYRVSAGEDKVRYLRAEFAVISGIEEEAEASVTLLEELMYRFDRLRCDDGRKPVMRVWVKAEETAYTELLFDEGFRVGNVMTVMTRPIDEDDWVSCGDVEIREFFDSAEEWDQYFSVNARSFGEPDSENEMRFRLKNPDAHVWVAIADDTLVAAVSTWPVRGGVYATENIFCDPEYRRRGITTKLLTYVLGRLHEAGASEARLTVYGDNLPAIRLYRKLGYSVAYELLEMHYFGREEAREERMAEEPDERDWR